jgi:Zn-dependent protease
LQSSFRIARIRGIDIGANWSWLLVVALVVWSLGAGVFPETNPGLGDGVYFAMAGVAVPVFFTSLLLHELGHAVQAQREGMKIEGITLWVFGGVAKFSGAFPSAGAEFRIAIAGPLVSLLIGVLFLAAALLVPLPSAVDGVVFWLGQINLTLLVFNMLPALPLDGGRVLRAALWQRRGDFVSATRSAAALGTFFGQFLIFSGLLLLFTVGAFGGVWLAFIGWFLMAAAEAERSAAETRTALAGVHVRDAMVADPVVVAGDMRLDSFLDDVFLRHRHTAYPVVEGGTIRGLLSFRQALAVPPERRAGATAAEAMAGVDDSLRVDADSELSDVVSELLATPLRRALVQHEGRVIGLLSATDALRILEARGRLTR